MVARGNSIMLSVASVDPENRTRTSPRVFFFQAKGGIRVIGVTGVQTCALPIYEAVEDRLQTRGQARPPVRRRQPRGSGMAHPALRGARVVGPARIGVHLRAVGEGHLVGEIGRASCRERV